jgi:dipeptidyl aminopeptidase/acylaminoacyl peptidase
MVFRTAVPGAALLASTLSCGALAAGTHVPTFTESLSRAAIRAPAISPDGSRVAYLQRQTDWKNNKYVWQLWLANVTTGTNTQLSQSRESSNSPQWSADGHWLAFVTQREPNALPPPASEKDGPADQQKTSHKQIWIISPDGGEAWQATNAQTDVKQFQWSPNGQWIVFTATAPESKYSKDRTDHLGAYQVVDKDFQQAQLWSIHADAAIKATGPTTPRQLTTDPALNIESFTISPDSARVAFSAAHNPLPAFGRDADLYLLELDSNRSPSRIVALEGPETSPLFSPDGKQLAFITSLAQENYFYANSHLAVVDMATVMAKPALLPRDVRDLSHDFDEGPQPLHWSPNGIYFTAAQKATTPLLRMDPISRRIDRVSAPDSIIDETSVTRDGQFVAFIAGDPTHIPELYVSATNSFAPRKLTNLATEVADWTLGSVEVVSWRSKDGTRIEGVLRKPADYDPKRKYPLLVVIHGGPVGNSLPKLMPNDSAYPVLGFLAKGALVLEPNYRGSSGYGAAFRALNVRNLGVGDMWDVMSGVDSLIAKGLVDPDRLGTMGWSQGGYISAFLTTHTTRFKAISVGAGISDWMTYYVGTDITPFTPQYLHATPWDDPQVYAKTSPITTIRQAKTPTLIQHGSEDRRVPPADAFELYRGLQDQHVDSRLILYTGFGHGIDKPKSNLAVLEANRDWFQHYIWNEPIPNDSALHGTSESDVAPPQATPSPASANW